MCARKGYLAVVRYLVELGADVGAIDIMSALSGRASLLQEEAGANMDDVTNGGDTV
jgi:hypothetical protein